MKQRKNHSLTHTCNAADRIDIGNRSASHLCNDYAKDMGWLTSENRLKHTLDRSKVGKQRRREREKIKAKEEKEISSRPAMVFGCDGTNPNIGRFQGCLPYLEKLLGHAVHCEVCLLYGNELPLRALFHFYYGKTSGPASFLIGKQLQEDLTRKITIITIRWGCKKYFYTDRSENA